MKKLFAALLSCILLFSLAACSSAGTSNEGPASPTQTDEQADTSSKVSQESNEQADDPSEAEQEIRLSEASETPSEAVEPETTSKALVVYFSATGNTKAVAETLAELQGADLYEIIPEQPYTDADLNYNDRSTRATVEQNDATARPAISGSIDNIGNYEVIYVGFPIWWGDMPRILYTFFDTYDLSDKTIAPFCTSGGSGISRAVQAISELEPSATATEGLQANSSNTAAGLTQWLNAIGLTERK